MKSTTFLAMVLLAAAPLGGCSEERGEGLGAGRRGPGGGPMGMGPGREREEAAAVPVEVSPVTRQDISSFIETNGVLEAETEVDIVARTAAPIAELDAEEGMEVKKGQVLARLDEEELRAQVEIASVNLTEAEQAFTRAKALFRESLISSEAYEQASAAYESAKAQLDASRIQLGFTEIRAPFSGRIINRYVDFAQQVSANTPLFRLSDFDPLLCPIQVPERELRRLFPGQSARIEVEAWPGEDFDAHVLRIRPVVDADTGTIKVTLEVSARDKLRPGMFARVFLETDTRRQVLVIPQRALSLESVGDTVYVAENGLASRREVELGYREGDLVQVVSGLEEGDPVVVVGQDGLSDGTPVQVVAGGPGGSGAEVAAAPPSGPSRRDFSQMTPEQLERVKERMRARGLTEEQIEERLKRFGATPHPDAKP